MEQEKLNICLNVKADLLDKYQSGCTGGPNLPQQSALGAQALSTKQSRTGAKFGSSARDGLYTKSSTPSPMEYTPQAMLGRVPASNGASYRRSAPSAKFVMAKRDAGELKSSTPGPGMILPSSLGDGKPLMYDSRVTSPPRATFGKSSGVQSKPESHKTPGPVYEIPSAMGTQPLARMKTAPSMKFGSSARDGLYGKSDTPASSLNGSTFGAGSRPVTSESTKRRAPNFSFGTGRDKDATPDSHKTPAPKYVLDSTIQRSPISTRKSPPVSKFGSAPRDGLYRPSDGPGPGSHDGAAALSSLGKQSSSRNRSCPSMKFGGSQERGDKAANDNPGPNAYGDVQRGIGKMTESTKRSLPSFSFGISRHAADRSRSGLAASPGPKYVTPSTIGKQSVSTIRTQATAKFGRGSRFAKSTDGDAPAPNAYPAFTGLGKQVESTRTSSPTPAFGESRAAVDRSRKSDKTPGPGAHKVPSALGVQKLSTLRSLPRAKFGSESRFRSTADNSTPGPGSYKATAYTAVAKTASSWSFRGR